MFIMHKKVSIKKLVWEVSFGYCLLYLLTMSFWDNLVGYSFKYFFYAIIILSAVQGFFYLITLNQNNIKNLWIAYLLLIGINSVITYVSFEKFIYGLIYYVICPMIFFSTIRCLNYINIQKTLKFLSVFSLLESFIAIYEYRNHTLLFFVSYVFTGFEYEGTQVYRARAFTESPLVLGMLMGIFVLINTHLYFYSKRKRYIIFAVINLVALFATSSRAPLVSSLVALLCMIMLKNRVENKIDRSKILKTYFLIIIVVFLLVFVFFDNNFSTNIRNIDYVLARIRSIFNWNDQGSNTLRVAYWTKFIEIWKSNLFFGVGINSTGVRGLNTYSLGITESGLLKRLVEIGLIGSVLYYTIILAIVKNGIKSLIKNMDKVNKVVIIGLGIVIAILIDDVVIQISESIIISVIFWFCLGIIFNYSCKIKRRIE